MSRSQDHFGYKAKREGYPARSVYKLEEIDKRLKLLRRGQRVLDLGAAPGSWTMYAAERVGREGKVLGIDLNEARVALPPQASFRALDVFGADLATELGPGSFEVVLSDMAPHTSGQRHRDQFHSYELYMRALEIARAVLVPGGNFVGKIFQGPELEQARAATREAFSSVRTLKPEASRSESFEIFLAGIGAR
ncbi:MAG TPA: RlmE family RNA methyltransferase [Polyangiales bacterium]|nr:RlmE family RNA methyltransferase [Polyangiales bacterium]